MRLSESEDHTTTNSSVKSSKSSKPTTPLDVLSSDYADMTLGNAKNNSSNSIRNTGPTLSPKENIKKLKKSFFGCSQIDENRMDCASSSSNQINQCQSNVTTINSKNTRTDDNYSDYTLMNPILGKRVVAQQPPLNVNVPNPNLTLPAATKKTALVTSNNNPDKVLANTQVKTSIDGFRPINARADKEAFQQQKSAPMTTVFNRQHSVPVEKPKNPLSDSSGYELLELRSSSSAHSVNVGRLTRPNSVNSEKTTFAQLMRPNSANSERQSNSTFSLTSTPLNESATSSVNIETNKKKR